LAETVVLKPREVGSTAARACRRQGLVPGIVYGKSIEPVAVALDASAMRSLTRGTGSHVHRVAVEGSSFEGNVMVQEVVYDPLTEKAVHIDLHRISLTEKVKAEVPVVVIGEDVMEKRNLILQRQLREITVESLPTDIPTNVTVDVSELNHGESITAGQITLPDTVKLITEEAEIIVVVVSPKVTAEKAEETPEGEEAEAEAADKPEN
jgi:large subunit ribosomal protein L25